MKIARVCGIEIIITNSLLALFIISGVLGIIPFAVVVFLIVLLHEAGHVIMACYFHLPVDRIELFPFGGVAYIQSYRNSSLFKETLVALAGPFTNLLAAGFVWIVKVKLTVIPSWLEFGGQVSMVMAVCNLIPALPLDGGRIVRALLAKRFGFFPATRLTAGAGQLLACIVFFFGLWRVSFYWVNFWWMLLAGYFFCAARREKRAAFLTLISYLTGKDNEIKRRGILPGRCLVMLSSVQVKQVLETLAPQNYHLIYVIGERGELLGILTERAVISAGLTGDMEKNLGEILGNEGPRSR
ncbi:MAG: site-2 protease family protein [Desulfitobacteriaceae bacterium]|nr:site-2 protease family protein [Desulfitobacteriaceae bacterium]